MVIPIEDIKEYREAREYALDTLAGFIANTLPDHRLILANKSYTIPTTKYVSVRAMANGGLNPSGMGNQAYYNNTADNGDITSVYQYALNVQLKCYKEDANGDLEYLRETFKDRPSHYEFFGKDPLVGVTGFGLVMDTPQPIDQQEMEPCATMNLTLTFIAKRVSTFGYITEVTGTTTTDSVGEEFTDEFEVVSP